MRASPDTLLRVIRAAALPGRETPTVLGVDDFALRRGRKYGTILIDLARRCRVDVLPDRTAETLAAWLEAHPGVEVISRDRGGAYAQGAREGAPEAVQVADRFHVLANLREALERLVARRHRALREAADALTERAAGETAKQEEPPVPEPVPEPTTRHERRAQERRARRVARYEEVRRLRAQGLSLRAIADRVGLNRQTVQRFVHAESFPERAKRAPYPSIADPYDDYLRRRWEEGCHNATQLWRELRAMGFTGSRSGLSERLARWRTVAARRPAGGSPPSPPPPGIRPRSPRQASWLLVRPPEELEAEDRAYLEELTRLCPQVAAAQPLAREFGRLVRERDQPALDRWLEAVDKSDVPELQSFAAGLRRDRQAVEQMLLTDWSNGQCEGQINRAKLLKRQMYGRAKFDLLRQRILRAA
jgi:transposase